MASTVVPAPIALPAYRCYPRGRPRPKRMEEGMRSRLRIWPSADHDSSAPSYPTTSPSTVYTRCTCYDGVRTVSFASNIAQSRSSPICSIGSEAQYVRYRQAEPWWRDQLRDMVMPQAQYQCHLEVADFVICMVPESKLGEPVRWAFDFKSAKMGEHVVELLVEYESKDKLRQMVSRLCLQG
ncbi:hypothetical protein L226DRAFT_211236 [Lentinus tigrinus ALCF2SS1-7]|uniref:uncharacterized protein n=1 Tax=Lentinus tigrinus ALCF2SS1-7 TaxID=1328758 RepID=UPI001165D49B|nr:hypothetical protein L226DRAFT_211236 [Lentinus tigrinus ALCF2SS1-7]